MHDSGFLVWRYFVLLEVTETAIPICRVEENLDEGGHTVPVLTPFGGILAFRSHVVGEDVVQALYGIFDADGVSLGHMISP